uniref:INCENP_ARK-bind domain-containing protein n=1 Tax=Elaeophora elaphi TaxID=1147741 RepID=A0A0R3RT24_9BILA
MSRFRENSESRVKERKKQIEKENEERRNQALTKIEQQTLNVAKNRERECREFSSTPIAKRTRSAYNSTPVAKRLHTKAVVFPELKAFYGSTMNQPVSPVEINSDQIASAKCNFKAAISKQSNMEAVFSPEFDCNSSEMTDSPEVTALSYSDEHMKQNCTDVELKNVLESCRTSEPFTAKDFSRLKQDEANINEVGNLSSTSLMSINTASIFEITAPTDKSFDIIKHSTPIIHRSEAHKVNSDYMIHKGGTKRSTYLTGDLKFEQETTVDNLHVMLMDVGSSSSKSTSTYASESDVVKKRAKVSNTRFPSRRTLDELEKQEFDRLLISANLLIDNIKAALHQSTDAKEKIEEDVTEYGISDLLSDARTESMEQPRKKIPSWATAENIRQSLEKQQTWSVIDINALFGKIHPPEMQKMLGDLAKLRPARRSSSAMWESPIWNPRVGYSAYHPTIEETNQQVYNVRRSQRTKSSVSYFPYL